MADKEESLNEIKLKTVTELLGMNFYIPEYQRGYRWTSTNVNQLLQDIWEYRQESKNSNTFYCLQPVVVRKKQWQDINNQTISGYELIDGQQRLTSIHRIITYLMIEFLKVKSLQEDYKKELYHIYYKTRLESKEFLRHSDYNKSKPDLYYMSEAYLCVKKWFEDETKGFGRSEKNRFLDVLLPEDVKATDNEKKIPEWSVQVIWYEIKDESQKSEDLFKRLNRGKIPLTSAELIKAKFVNANSFDGFNKDDKIKRRTQLVQIWDEIENQLNNPKFWAFISNESISKYSNKIEYLFDIVTEKKAGEKDSLYSFINFFEEKETAESLWQKWMTIEEIYRSLMYWYADKNFYHKIGYLIVTGTGIGKLIKIKKDRTKDSFETELNHLIATKIDNDWQALSYGKQNEHGKIINVLLLVNIELTRINQNNNEFFPFQMYKSINKSLEHINAQNILDIDRNKKEQWITWLYAHINVLPQIALDKERAIKVIEEVKETIPKIIYEDFRQLSDKILNLIPKEEGNADEYLHKLENMALLGLTENIVLSNSIFEVKRTKIMEMDKAGAFIPLATKRVFLKYYANENTHHYSVWTAAERKAYSDEIKNSIEKYKPVTTKTDEE
jgi:uncharacterized protein with ParB-like and HNH nuclease domain